MGQLEDILKHQNMARNNIMKSFGAETSEDSLEKSFEDEVNPFEMEAYKSELTKAELSEKVAKDKGWIKDDDKKKSEKSSYESKEADAYDKGDGKVGNYPVPTHTSYPAANLYSRLKNNRHFGFKYGLPEEEIMKKLKDYKGNVKVSYHNNAGTSEIYRIKFL